MSADLLTVAPLYRELRKRYRHRLVWIYAIQAGEGGPVKIGMTKRPRDRLKTLQQAHAVELKPLAAWFDFPEVEKLVHEDFAHLRIRGEWFEPAPELLEHVLHEGGDFEDWS